MSERMTRRRFIKVGAAAAGTIVVGGGALAAATSGPNTEKPEWRMGEGTMKALVVYGTKTGCTAGIAEQAGKTLSENGFSVEVVPAESAGDPSGYDAVLVGSGVRAGTWHAPVRSWIEANAAALKSRPVAFYTCGLTTAQKPEKANEVRAYTDPLIESTGVKPVDVGVFAGWNEPATFPFVERTILKLMKAPVGDFRNMDAVAAWTEGLLPKLTRA